MRKWVGCMSTFRALIELHELSQLHTASDTVVYTISSYASLASGHVYYTFFSSAEDKFPAPPSACSTCLFSLEQERHAGLVTSFCPI